MKPTGANTHSYETKVIEQTSKAFGSLQHCCIWVPFLMLVVLAPIHAQSLTALGDLPGGSFDSRARGVSSDGSVIVGVGRTESGIEAVRWTSSTGIQGLGDLAGGTFQSEAYGVSGDGSVIVGRSVSDSGLEAFRWTVDDGMMGLGDLNGGTFYSSAFDANYSGNVIVGESRADSGNEGFLWTANGMVGLGDLPGGITSSSAAAISADGLIIVGTGNSDLGSEATLWSTSGIMALGDLFGGTYSNQANSVSSDGLTVVGAGSTFGSFQGTRWTSEGGLVGLGHMVLNDETFNYEATDVSGDGRIVVGSGETLSDFGTMIWTADSGPRFLRDVLIDFGVDLSEWTWLNRAHAISDDGRTIVGFGTRFGNTEAWAADFRGLELHWRQPGNGAWDQAFNWTSSLFTPGDADHAILDPPVGLVVTGPGQATTVDQLTIGISSGQNGVTSLALQSAGYLTVNGVTYINYSGRLLGQGALNAIGGITNRGEIDLGDGELNIPTGCVDNESGGLIHGDGQISELNNQATVRVDSGKRILLTHPGTQTNQGNIALLGGTLQSTGSLCNDLGFISGRGTIIVEGDFFNSGVFAFSAGYTDLFGDLEIFSGGSIVSSGGATTTFYDDVIHDGMEIRTSANSATVFFGAVSGSGPFTGTGDIYLEGDLQPGNSPAAVEFEGNLFLGGLSSTEIEIGGVVAGSQHDQLIVAGNLDLAGTLNVSLIDDFDLEPGQHFKIATVGGSASGEFAGLSEGDVVGNFGGLDLLITYIGGDGNDVALFTEDPIVLLGDINLDGVVNLLDVDPFIGLLGSGDFQAEADCNEDGTVNLLDVDPFIAILGGG